MTLDELKSIESAARDAKIERERALRAAGELAAYRKSETLKTTAQLVKRMSEWGGPTSPGDIEFLKVLDEFRGDMLRIAEMRFEARARAAGQHERMLRAQLAGFLGEPNGEES